MSQPCRKVAGAIAAGCSIILKAAEETPAGALHIARALHDAGLPPGVLNLVFGTPAEISDHLIRQETVRLVAFTGSTTVGTHLTTLAALLDLDPGKPVVITGRARADDPWRVPVVAARDAAAGLLHLLMRTELEGPINITVRPVACTATIMHDLMGDAASDMPENLKAVMLSCILSDTLEFRSPTTTDADKLVAVKLAAELGSGVGQLINDFHTP